MPDSSRDNRTSANDPFPLSRIRGEFGQIADATAPNSIGDLPTTHELDGDGTASGGYLGITVSQPRLRLFFLTLAACLTLISCRLIQIQLIEGSFYQDKAEGNRTRVLWTPSPRGIIYDRNGKTLVRNVPNFSVTVRPDDLPAEPERGRILDRLAGILGLDPTEVRSRIEAASGKAGDLAVLGDHLTHDQAVLIDIEAAGTGAVSLVIGTRREYPVTAEINTLSHVIGFEGRPTEADLGSDTARYLPSDFLGKTGLEKQYETLLRGRYGMQTVEIDAYGHKKEIISEEAGVPGQNLVLTIDLDLQRQAEKVLKEQLRATGKARGSLVVLEPKTGEVLALVSEPAYDNNLFARGISADDYRSLAEDKNNPLFPRAVAASLPAGSTFKLVVAAAAIEEGLIGPNTSILSSGGVRVDKWFFPDWKAGGHGVSNVTKAIAESVNTFFYAIGGGLDKTTGLGVDRIIKYAAKFGLGQPLGIDLTGEGAGFLPSKDWKETTKKESWYIGDTYHLAIGQGDILVTPLQIAAMTAVFANGGRLVRPRLVNATTSSDGTRAVREPVILDERVVGPEAVDLVRRGMRQAVTAGSARSLGGLPVAVAAKTGTAQWSSARDTHAWFTSFAPYSDPKLVVTVVIEEGGEGSTAAAPVAARLYSWYFGKK